MTNPLPLEVRFLKRYARQLHMAGVPAHQFERMMTALADKLGFNCNALSSPTSIFLSFQYQDDEDDNLPVAGTVTLSRGKFGRTAMRCYTKQTLHTITSN